VDERGRPHVVVVTFALAGDVVVTAVDHKPKSTQRLARLRHIEANPQVSLLVDHYDEDWSRLWWARAEGTAQVLTDAAERAEPVDRLVAKYPQYAQLRPAGPVIQVAVERWTGWTGEA
jgi:PPOX class probable F420-dependent enzyme